MRPARKRPEDLIPNRLGVGAEVEEDPRCDAFVLARESKQEVLSADVVVPEGDSFAHRELEHLFRARRERDLAGCDLVALADDSGHLCADRVDLDAERFQSSGGCASTAQQPEQEVLGADEVVVKAVRLLLRKDDDVARGLGEALERGG
jgi:hypothetical protein